MLYLLAVKHPIREVFERDDDDESLDIRSGHAPDSIRYLHGCERRVERHGTFQGQFLVSRSDSVIGL
jgi:hypothetical protein